MDFGVVFCGLSYVMRSVIAALSALCCTLRSVLHALDSVLHSYTLSSVLHSVFCLHSWLCAGRSCLCYTLSADRE